MKTKYILMGFSAGLLGCLASCDVTDIQPRDSITDESYWNTTNDLKTFAQGFYTNLGGAEDPKTYDERSDDRLTNSPDNWLFDTWTIPASASDASWTWTTIRNLNYFMSRYDQVDDTEMSVNPWVAVVRFFRAQQYFSKIKTFGDVPWYDRDLSTADIEELYKPRDSRDFVLSKIIEDLDFAIEWLPDTRPAEEYGRLTKGAARAMKARAALYYNDWEVAASESKAVIDSGLYELFDAENTGRYEELFWESQEACSEAILVRQYNYPDNTNYLIGWEAFPTLGWGGINPTQSLVDAFECIDGAPITESPLYDETNPFENRDPRLEVDVLHDGETMYDVTIKVAPLASSGNTGIAQHGDATATGYYQQKWLDPSIYPTTDGWNMGKDWHIIRFAEVLLTYAEAQNEISPLDASAFEAVNRVRRRVGMPELQSTDATSPTYCGTQDALRQRIRNEWRVEFALEGDKRQWDIRRWGIASQVLNQPLLGLKYTLVDDPENALEGDNGQVCILYQGTNVVAGTTAYSEHNYLYPVPQTEIDLNPALGQNPGY